MKKIILLVTCLSLSFNSSVYANEPKCKFYDLVCKTGKFAKDTKEYQKKEFEKASKKKKKKINVY